MNEVEEGLQSLLIGMSAQIVDIDAAEVSWEADIDEYGFASIEVNRLCAQLSDYFAIDIQPVVFLEATSLQALSRYLLDHYPAQIEQRCS
jgi:hypothetical protein